MTQLAFETADIPGLLRDIQGAMQRGDLAGAGARVAQVLRREPDNRDGLYLDAVVRRYQDDLAGALAALDHLLALYPAHGRALQERGHCLLAQGDRAGALAAYQGAVATNAALPAAWRRLAELQEGDAADYALAQHDYLAALPPPLLGVAGMIQENRLSQAEALCRQFLQANPTHAEGMRLLAEIAQRFQVVDEAEFLLESAIAIEPDNIGARYDYARVLNKRQKFAEALDQARHLRRIDPDSMMIASLEADQNLAVGNFDAALEHYRQRVADHPRNPGYHLTLGHVLKTVDAIPEALAAYRAAYGLRPDFGAAYWSLANLKTYRFDDAELAQMEAQEQLPRTALADRYHLCFALGKALEDRGIYDRAFACYERGNRLKREEVGYDWRRLAREMQDQIDICDAGFIAALGEGAHRARSDLHRRPAARGLDPARTDPRQPQPGRGHDGTAQYPGPRAQAGRATPGGAGFGLSGQHGRSFARRAARAGRGLCSRYGHSPQAWQAVLHRQDAQQFPPHRPDPRDLAECADHRCAPRRDGLLFLGLQATLRRGPRVHLWP
jgi:tetratricopeptide (TPR) repeat protein